MQNVNVSRAKSKSKFICELSRAGFFNQCLGNYLRYLEEKNRTDFTTLINLEDIKNDTGLLKYYERKIFNLHLECLTTTVTFHLYKKSEAEYPGRPAQSPPNLRDTLKEALAITELDLMKFLDRFMKVVETDRCLLKDMEMVSGNLQVRRLVRCLWN